MPEIIIPSDILFKAMSPFSMEERVKRLDNGVRMALYAFYQDRIESGDTPADAQKYAKKVVKEYIKQYAEKERIHHNLEHPVSISSEEVKDQIKTLPSKSIVTNGGINFDRIDSYDMTNDISLFNTTLTSDNCREIRWQWGHDSIYNLSDVQNEYLNPLTGKNAKSLGDILKEAGEIDSESSVPKFFSDLNNIDDPNNSELSPRLIASIFFPSGLGLIKAKESSELLQRGRSFLLVKPQKKFEGFNNGANEFASTIINCAMQKRALKEGGTIRLSEQLGMIAFIAGTVPFQGKDHFNNIQSAMQRVIDSKPDLQEKLKSELSGSTIEAEFKKLKEKPEGTTVIDYFIDKTIKLACQGANRDTGNFADKDPRILYCGDNNVGAEFAKTVSILEINNLTERAVEIIKNIDAHKDGGFIYAKQGLLYHDFESEFEVLSVKEADKLHEQYFINAEVVTRMHQADLVQTAAQHLYPDTKPVINFADFTPEKLEELTGLARIIFPRDLAKSVAEGKMNEQFKLGKEDEAAEAAKKFKSHFTESKSQSADVNNKTPAGLQWYEAHEKEQVEQKTVEKEKAGFYASALTKKSSQNTHQNPHTRYT